MKICFIQSCKRFSINSVVRKIEKYIESINNHGCGCGVVYFSIDFQGNTAGNVAIYQSYIKFGLFLILR